MESDLWKTKHDSQNGHPASGLQKNKQTKSIAATTINFVTPFRKGSSIFKVGVKELLKLVQNSDGGRCAAVLLLNIVVLYFLYGACQSSSSLALAAYIPILWFNVLSMACCMFTLWVDDKEADGQFTFGYMRCEILCVFSSIMLVILISIFTIKECIERAVHPQDVTGQYLIGYASLALFMNSVTLYQLWVQSNAVLDYLVAASSSSFLQEQFTDICSSFCNRVNNPILKPRVNPLVLVTISGFCTILIDQCIMDIYSYRNADTFLAVIIIIQVISTMLPMCVCSAKILLQTVPANIWAHLEQLLRESLTIDGVLELNEEKFWVLGVKKRAGSRNVGGCVVVGSLQVRVRRDANEQLVLRLIQQKLKPLVYVLTVQVMKDEWTKPDTSLTIAQTSTFSPASSAAAINFYTKPYMSTETLNSKTSQRTNLTTLIRP